MSDGDFKITVVLIIIGLIFGTIFVFNAMACREQARLREACTVACVDRTIYLLNDECYCKHGDEFVKSRPPLDAGTMDAK